MQVAQRVHGHILPAIDGQEANWMRDVELLLIASVQEGNTNQYTRQSAIAAKCKLNVKLDKWKARQTAGSRQ